jgi:glycine cleavage system H protein
MKNNRNFNIRTDLWYDADEGFWLDVQGNTARVGVNPLVQETSGSLVAVSLNEVGTILSKGDSFGSLEAEKHVGHLKTPVSGKIVAINTMVLENPRLINSDPYGKGWLVVIELTRFAEEQRSLLTGEREVIAWFESEIAKYEDKGWIAES